MGCLRPTSTPSHTEHSTGTPTRRRRRCGSGSRRSTTRRRSVRVRHRSSSVRTAARTTTPGPPPSVPGRPAKPGRPSISRRTTDFNGVPNLFSVPPAIDATGKLTFTPAPDQVGLVHVTVRAKDDGGLEDWNATGQPAPADTSGDVTFDIVVVPDAVTAVDDATTLPEDPDPGPWDDRRPGQRRLPRRRDGDVRDPGNARPRHDRAGRAFRAVSARPRRERR